MLIGQYSDFRIWLDDACSKMLLHSILTAIDMLLEANSETKELRYLIFNIKKRC